MNTDIKKLLEDLRDNKTTVDEVLLQIKTQPFTDLGFAKADTHRTIRQGNTEVIYGAGKTAEQIIKIAKALSDNNKESVLITRLDKEKATIISKELDIEYNETAKTGILGSIKKPDGIGKIVIITAGTSDIPVAEEAEVTAKFLGNDVVRINDVGVSGIHRLLSYSEDIMNATVIIAIAGMEGALASVVGGLSDCPVIAVPTSVGYGAAFEGLTALLAMINSCASGVSVVNIDNGFGAAYQASMINHIK